MCVVGVHKRIWLHIFLLLLWLSVMLAGPEIGDHFTFNLYNKVIPQPISEILEFSTYNRSFIGYCVQDLFKIAHCIFLKFSSSFSSKSTTSQILTICRIFEGVRVKTFRRHYYLSTLPRPSIPYTEGRWSKFYWHTAYQKKP